MKYFFPLIFFFSFFLNTLEAQLPDGSTAPNWTLTDIYGETHTLYDYLYDGKVVFIEFFATNCNPCWNFHNTGTLDEVYELYGPDGTDEVMVFMVEIDPNSNDDCIFGLNTCSNSTFGDWATGTPFPIINDHSLFAPYWLSYTPTIYGICQDSTITELGTVGVADYYDFAQSCPPVPLAVTDIDVTDVSCFGAGDGAISISVTGGTYSYSFLWSNGMTSQNINGLSGGNYYCTITDTGNESVTIGPVEVFEYDIPLTASVSTSDVGCNDIGGNIFLTVTGGCSPYGFIWNTGATSQHLLDLQIGTYSVTVTDSYNAIVTIEDITINQASPPEIEIFEPNDINCINSIDTLEATSTSSIFFSTYSWTTQDGNILSGENSLLAIIDGIGTYVFSVYDQQTTCISFDSVIVSGDFETPSVSVGIGDVIDCNNPTITLEGTGDSGSEFIIEWTTNDGTIVSGGNTINPIISSAGTYTLTITNTGNGCSGSSSVDITEDFEVPEISVTFDVLTCENTSVEICGNSTGENCSFSWEGPENFSSEEQCTSTSTAGTYTLSVTCENGCIATTEVEIEENIEIPTANAGEDGVLTCNIEELTLDGSNSSSGDNYSYLWSTSDGNIVSGENTLTPIVNTGGTYVLIVIENETGCESFPDSVFVGVAPIDISPEAVIQEISCYGESTGEIALYPSGGNPPYSYEWSTGNTTNIASNLGQGSYSVTITDTYSCQTTATFYLSQPDELVLIIETTDQTGNNIDDGTAFANISGGTPAYSYEWSTGETGQEISGLTPGDYSLTIIDANGCSLFQTFVINTYGCSLQISEITYSDVSCFGGNDGEATVTTNGGELPFTFLWSTGDTTAEISNLISGTYFVTVADLANCVVSNSITIEQPEELFLSITSTDETAPEANDGTADAFVSGGVEPYSYEWNNEMTTSSITNLSPGQYFLTISDANGCTIENSIIINDSGCNLDISFSKTDVSCYGKNDGNATATIENGVGQVSFLWSTGETEATVSELAAGVYQVVVTDSLLCQVIDSIEISEPEEIAVSIETSLDNCECFDITSSVTGGTAPYQFWWSNGSTNPNPECLSQGNFFVTIIDGANCWVIDNFDTPEIPESPTIEVIDVIDEIGSNANGSIDITVSGGTPPFNFEWLSNGEIISNNEDISEIPAGYYIVNATDANNCTTSLTVHVNSLVGTNELFYNSKISIYPNPAKDKINIVFSSIPENKITIIVYNVTGNAIKELKISQLRERTVELNLLKLPAGLFFVKILTGKENFTKRILLTN